MFTIFIATYIHVEMIYNYYNVIKKRKIRETKKKRWEIFYKFPQKNNKK